MQSNWKYSDTLCSGCNENEESGKELGSCDSFGSYKSNEIKLCYENSVRMNGNQTRYARKQIEIERYKDAKNNSVLS